MSLLADRNREVALAAARLFRPTVLLPSPPWFEIARPEQLPPEGDWLVWAFIAGRGAGKTRAMAEWVNDQVRRFGKHRIALISRTPADVRDVMIEGEAGILACSPDDFRPEWNPSIRRLTWPNGAVAFSFSSENPGQLRGPSHDLAWTDEPAAWDDAKKGDVLDTSWNNLMLGMRVRGGSQPRVGFSTTPKNNRLIRDVLGKPSTVKTTGTTYDNLANLTPTFKARVLSAYEGTRIGRQELLGELLTDVEGALIDLDTIDHFRVTVPPIFTRVVLGVDPATTSGEDSDETGIIVAAKGADGHGYVLADRSGKFTPNGWARRVVETYKEYEVDRVVTEVNQGGDTWEEVLRSVMRSISYKSVHAKDSKRLRAEPVMALYEQGRIHHVGSFPKLEDQLTQWVPGSGESPDRLDALVHAFAELGLAAGGHGYVFAEYMQADIAKREVGTVADEGRPLSKGELAIDRERARLARLAARPTRVPRHDHLYVRQPDGAIRCNVCQQVPPWVPQAPGEPTS